LLAGQIQEGISLVTCRTEKIDENGELLQPGYFLADGVQPDRWNSDFENEGIDEINLALKYRCTLPNASAVIFHKSLAKFVDDSLGFKAAGDWFFWVNCLSKTKFRYIAEPLCYHRFHEQTTRGKKSVDQEKNRMYEFLACINLAHKKLVESMKSNSIELRQYNWVYYELFERGIQLKEIFRFRSIPLKFAYGYWKYINKRTKRFKKISQKIKRKSIQYLKSSFSYK
jgi:hypothetical protein